MAEHTGHGARAALEPEATDLDRDVGWYRHLTRPREHRYWDGVAWTDWTDLRDAGARRPEAVHPTPGPPSRGSAPVPRPRGGSATDSSPSIGSFTWDTETDALAWSTQNYLVHGYEPGQVAADVPLMLRHKLPADRGRTERVMERCRTSGGSFSLHHRILDAHQRLRVVVTVAVETTAPDEAVSSGRRLYSGHVADVTEPATRAATEAVVASRVSAAAIQQSIAVLQLLLDVPEEGAMTILRRYSSHHDVTLSTLARDVMTGTRLPWFREEAKDAAAARRLLAWAVDH